MWGTDYPLILHAESLEQIGQPRPQAARRSSALLHDTAAKVFKLEDTTASEPQPAGAAEAHRRR